MKNKSLLLLLPALIGLAMLVLPSCSKKFDEPPVANTTLAQQGITANTNIATLKSMVGNADGAFRQITSDIVITGVISGDDRSGNLYKELYLQDTSGAMSIELDATGLFSTFPVGREVAIYCKGLWLVNTKAMKKLCQREVVNGTASAVGIPAADIGTYVKGGAVNQPVAVKSVTMTDLTTVNTNLLGALVKLDNVEVVNSDLRKTWSDISPAKIDQNIYIKDCSNTQIIIRTSAYANFAGVRVAQGNGSVVALYTAYNTTPQLLLRDTSDAKLWNIRCDGSVPGTPDTVRTIDYIRSLGVGATVQSHTVIRGIIASNSSNEASGNFIIQDASGYGIQMHFTSARSYSLNDSVEVDVSGATVGRFNNGALQLTNVGYVSTFGQGSITPRVTTIADIMANQANWESTVVTLNNVTIAQTSTNSTGVNYSITDATGSITTFVRNSLGLTLPTSATSITGYVGIFSGTAQLNLREAGDVR